MKNALGGDKLDATGLATGCAGECVRMRGSRYRKICEAKIVTPRPTAVDANIGFNSANSDSRLSQLLLPDVGAAGEGSRIDSLLLS